MIRDGGRVRCKCRCELEAGDGRRELDSEPYGMLSLHQSRNVVHTCKVYEEVEMWRV